MTRAIVFAWSVQEGLDPVVGAAPHTVLSRQLPRLMVNLLNSRDGSEDLGLRFFPWLGPVSGRRQFFNLPDLVPLEKLQQVHGQKHSPQLFLDGRIERDGLRLRLADAVSKRELWQEVLPFSSLDPLPVLTRMMFELTGALGWQGAPPPLPSLADAALGHYLVAKDDLLHLEANMLRADAGSFLKAIRMAQSAAPDSVEVQELLLEICARLTSSGLAMEEVSELLLHAAADVATPSFLQQAASLLDSLGKSEAAVLMMARLVEQQPGQVDLALRVVGHYVSSGMLEEAKGVLQAALSAGAEDPRLLAQLLVVRRQLGLEFSSVLQTLSNHAELPVQVVRLVAMQHLECGAAEKTLACLQQHLPAYPESAELWMEKARAHLHLGDTALAQAALQSVLQRKPSDTLRQEVRRLQQFTKAPETLQVMSNWRQAAAEGDQGSALRYARTLVARQPELGEAWMFLGVTRQRMGHQRRAIRALRRGVSLDPELGEAHDRLGILLVGRGKHQEGYEHLNRAVRLLPGESGPRLHLAQACHYLGLAQEGQAALAEAQRLGADPDLVLAVRRAFFAERD